MSKQAHVEDILRNYVAEHTEQTGGPLSAGYSYLTLTVKEGEKADCLYGADKPCERPARLRHFDPEDGSVPSYSCLTHFLEYLNSVAVEALKDRQDGKEPYTLRLSDDHLAGNIQHIADEWAAMWVESEER